MKRLKNEFIKEMAFVNYRGKNVVIRIEERDGYDTFNHIASNEKDGHRMFDYERAKYLLNVSVILNQVDENDQVITFKDGDREIIYLLEEDNDFMIVLEEETRHFVLVTAFKVNRSNSRNYYYKDKILELDNLEYSHNYNFTKIYKLATKIKDIYIDEVVKTWIEDFYTQDIIFRIIANAIKLNRDKILFMVYKNQHFVPKEDREYIYIISKYSNSLNDEKLLTTMEFLESAIVKLENIYKSEVNNNLKFIRMYFVLENVLRKIARKYGECKLLYTCVKTIEREIGYFAPNTARYKIYKQIPEICGALFTRDESKIRSVFDEYKIEYNDANIMCDKYLHKYYEKYIKRFLVEFKRTIYGS